MLLDRYEQNGSLFNTRFKDVAGVTAGGPSIAVTVEPEVRGAV